MPGKTTYPKILFLAMMGSMVIIACSASNTPQCEHDTDCPDGQVCIQKQCTAHDPCAGVECTDPPGDLACYDLPAPCEQGACRYSPLEQSSCDDHDPCTLGDRCTEAGQCTGTPMICDDLPPPECIDNERLITYSAGVCENGECTFESHETPCDNGCLNGRCQDCTPEGTCPQEQECGEYIDACGYSYNCGDCLAWQTCQDGTCIGTATEFYVSPQGSGDDCTMEKPCLLNSARAAVRACNHDMNADIHVILRGGTYTLSQTFELGAQDSGTNNHNVIYEAFPGEAPVLSGGVQISGWSIYDNNRNIYRAQVPDGLRTRQLYVNGIRAQRARSALNPPGFVETENGYTAPDSSMASWTNPTDVEFVDLVYWKTFRCPVASISGTTITMAQPCWTNAQFHQGYDMGTPSWIENAYELLDQPGEWYLDSTGGFIYYIPRPGEDMHTAELIAPALESIMGIAGSLENPAHNIRFTGIGFSYATWLRPSSQYGYPCVQAGYQHVEGWTVIKTPGNVTLHKVHDVQLERCTFEHLGASALVMEYGSRDNLVQGCVFRDISGGAIQVGDVDNPNPADDREVTRNNIIRNNLIEDCSQEYFDGVGIFAGYTDGTTIEHNEIRNVSYSGISVGWGWSTASTVARNNHVQNNLGSHVMQRLKDGGQIYTLSSQPDSSISGNYFHNQVHVYGSIYLDQGTQYYTITDNVIASAPYWYIMQPQVAPRAQNNVMSSNFSDTSDAYCCGGLGCCTDVNTLSNNSIFSPGNFPIQAQRIMANAGIQKAYRDIRGDRILVEAEDYNHGGPGVGYMDLNSGNQGGAYRDDDVDVYPCQSCSNAHTIGYTQTGEWLAYYIDSRPGGLYDFKFTVGTQDAQCALELFVDGVSKGTLDLPNTGSWSSFEQITKSGVFLSAGAHLIRLVFTGGFNLDAFEYNLVADNCNPGGNLQAADVLDGDFDGDGQTDTLSIYQQNQCWDVTSLGSTSVWHTAWGRGSKDLVGDFDGDGMDDLVIIFQDASDQSWHWHLGLSTGSWFASFPDAHVGYGYGDGACVRDYDGDGVDEVIVLWTPSNICADLDPSSGTFVMNSNCSHGCD